MIILKIGDRLPSVAVAQMFLNLRGDNPITVDGAFGKNTRAAVKQFQHQKGQRPTGRIEYNTWQRLNPRGWQIVDSVDATDPNIQDFLDFQAHGGSPIRNYGMSNGINHVLNQIHSKSKTGRVALLRFHGHGSPGHMIVSSGRSGDDRSSFELNYPEVFWRKMHSLRPIFAPMGSVEFHGCNVGRGRRGRNFLTRLANIWGVPVTAALGSQYGGGRASYRFEGPTRTICPNGANLKLWASQRTTSPWA